MKFTRIALTAMITISCLLTPVKKAEAGFVVAVAGGGLAAAVIMTSGLGIGLSTMLFEDHSRNTKISNVFFGIGVAIMLLDTPADMLSAELAREFPSIPEYIISEVAQTVKEKADAIPFSLEGIKSITLTSAEVSEIEAAMPLDVPSSELKAFRALLINEIKI